MRAFPNNEKYTLETHGMELRDYFAAKALVAIGCYVDTPQEIKKLAKEVYVIADAMMEARK